MSWGNLGVARIRDTARESQLGINRVIIRGLRIAVRTMGGCARAPTQICTPRHREGGRGLIDMQTRARTRAYVQKCIRTPPRTRALPRIRTRRDDALLCLTLLRKFTRWTSSGIRGGNGIFSIDAPRLNRRLYFSFSPRRALIVGLVENRGIEFFWKIFLILRLIKILHINLVMVYGDGIWLAWRFFCDIVTLERERLDVVVGWKSVFVIIPIDFIISSRV